MVELMVFLRELFVEKIDSRGFQSLVDAEANFYVWIKMFYFLVFLLNRAISKKKWEYFFLI